MKNRKAGTERPYTFSEFFTIVTNIAKERKIDFLDKLDYIDGHSWEEPDEITERFAITSVTTFGGSEGIYSDFILYNDYYNNGIHFATAKTLYESGEAFVRMSTMAANICMIAREYISTHQEEFNWSGFEVYINENPWLICPCKESAITHAKEFAKEHPDAKVRVRDNSTRKDVEYK